MPEPAGQHTHILQQEKGYENGNGVNVLGRGRLQGGMFVRVHWRAGG
jgi:hypothetical protein